MKLIRITDRIYMYPFERRSDRPNLYYVKGDSYSVVVDAGNSEAHVNEFYRELRENNLELPRYTVITHWHWDHTFGMHAVSGKVICSKLTNDKLKEVRNWEWTVEKMREREAAGQDIAFCNNCILVEYENLSDITVTLADEIVEKERVLDLGGVHLYLYAEDSTHSRDSLFIYAPEEKALFVADADCEDYYDNNSQYDKQRLEKMIQFISGFDYEHHLLGHDYEETKEFALDRLKGELSKLRQN